jgi:hypothetical protein
MSPSAVLKGLPPETAAATTLLRAFFKGGGFAAQMRERFAGEME